MNNVESQKQAQVIILGTFHFGECGEHLIHSKVPDVMSAERQLEIEELLDKLAQFKPTKIAVENNYIKFEEINNCYKDYCEGKHYLSRNEIEQIGFRLAAKLNHPAIYPVDVPVDLPDDAFEYAEKHCPEYLEQFMEKIKEGEMSANNIFKTGSITDIFKYENDPIRAKNEHSEWYLEFSQIGAGDTFYGADFLSAWYDRNVRIFSNLLKITEPDDRIIVLYGAGHLSILKEFVSSYNKMELVDAVEYL